jgi:hypothetical protein
MVCVRLVIGATVVAALGVGPVRAQEMFIYPSKGQSAAQQDKDKYSCYSWAKGQTGFDPMAPPTTRTPPPSGGHKSVAGGAVGGAMLGAGVGALGGAVAGGKAGKGAKIGTATGGLLGGMSAAGQNQQASQNRRDWERQEANRYANARAQYNRAFATCMEGRGYAVK